MKRRENQRASHDTLVLVEHLHKRDKVYQALKLELQERQMDEQIWLFDAKPENPQNVTMLKLLKSGGQQVPKIVVAWHTDSVGVTFWKRCFVMMTFQP